MTVPVLHGNPQHPSSSIPFTLPKLTLAGMTIGELVIYALVVDLGLHAGTVLLSAPINSWCLRP
ncbi:hypothetical protein EV122DRAFT_283515 [Schizophyllum commune]